MSTKASQPALQWVSTRMPFDELGAVPADGLAMGHVVIGKFAGSGQR